MPKIVRTVSASASPKYSGDIFPGRAGKHGALDAYTGYALRRAQMAVFDHFIAILAEVDLRPAQFSLLTLVDANPGVVQARVGEYLGIAKANLVPLVSALEKRKLLRRVPLDGRTNGLHLTAAGRQTIRRARLLNDRAEARATHALSPRERRQLLELAWRVAEAT